MRSQAARVLATVTGLALLLTGCRGAAGHESAAGSAGESDAAGSAGESDAAVGSQQPADTTATPGESYSGDLVVLAAASLAGVFTELGEHLEQQYPELTVTFSFAGSSALAEQVNAGAPADVLATANAATMAAAAEHTGEPVTFATNSLVIVTPPQNPGGVNTLADFARPELRLAGCAVEVPCGSAAEAVFAAGGIHPALDTYTEDVTAALTLALQGEVDATLVYTTDAAAVADRLRIVSFPEAAAGTTENLVAPVTGAPNPDAAAAFLELLLSPEGRAVLDAAGFGPPPP